MDAERVVVVVEQVEAFADVGKSYPTLLLIGHVGFGVAAGEMQVVVLHFDGHLDEGFPLVADAMFEGILDEGDEDERRDLAVGHFVREVERDLHLLRIAQLHQFHIGANEFQLLRQRHTLLGFPVPSPGRCRRGHGCC